MPIKWSHGRGGRRLDKETRQMILAAYLRDPDAAQELASAFGLAPLYAYKLANAMGALPVKGERVP